MKEKKEEKPSKDCEYLIQQGLEPNIALEIDQAERQKSRRKKRIKDKEDKDSKWK
jgi:hypothetical protein